MKINYKETICHLIDEIKNHRFIYITLFLILVTATFVRVYRVDQILGFFYDQGRDALVIWDLWHKGKFFLIGPTTGIAGIFRGPWYYYLIAPFYLIGKGDPIYPAIFLAATSVLAIYVLYILGKKISDRTTGLIAAFIAAFSYYIVSASRWLSNPTPMLLISVLLLWSILKAAEKKVWAWYLIAFLVGMAVQFGSAAEIFYIPSILIFIFWQKRALPPKKVFFVSLLIFLMSFMPQVLFDIKHRGILLSAFRRFLFEDKSFRLSIWEIITTRFAFYYNLIISKFWVERKTLALPFLIIFLLQFLLKRSKYLKNAGFKILTLLITIPIVGMLFFQGNDGVIYDYYFTGYYLLIILFFAILIRDLARTGLGKLVVYLFFIMFILMNFKTLKMLLSVSEADDKKIIYSSELKVIDWIYQNSNSQKFNVDVYVPPVIPYAYDYLFLWYGNKKCGESLCGLEKEATTKLLYTIEEYDLEYPTRVDPWLERQDKIGKIEKEAKFGGITTQRRIRL
jgi:4-amino-4-deoxy-L-arabinose transferase-like glycosyltransferase